MITHSKYCFIEELMSYIVGIAGGSGSGKTTFAKSVAKGLGTHCTIIHMDSYYMDQLPAHIDNNFDHPDAFDWELLLNHLKLLKQDQEVYAPIYDFKTNSRSEKCDIIPPREIIFIEGIYALYHSEVRDILDLKSFIQVEADIRLSRRLNRDFRERGRSYESIITQYYKTVRPMHNKFIEPQKDHADFIVGEENSRAVDLLRNHLLTCLPGQEYELQP